MWKRYVTTLPIVAVALAIGAATWEWRASRLESSRQRGAEAALASERWHTLRLERVSVAPVEAQTNTRGGPGESCVHASGRCGENVAINPVNELLAAPRVAAGANQLRAALGLQTRQGYLLLILFSPTDCALCLQESRIWNDLAMTRRPDDRLDVVGIVDHTTVTEMKPVLRQLALKFPVYVDESSVIRQMLAAEATPVKVLIDPTGHVRMLDGPHQQRVAQSEVGTRVREIIAE